MMPAGRREIGQGSSQSFRLAVQHEDVIFQAAAKGRFGDLRTKGSRRKALEMSPQPLPRSCTSYSLEL